MRLGCGPSRPTPTVAAPPPIQHMTTPSRPHLHPAALLGGALAFATACAAPWPARAAEPLAATEWALSKDGAVVLDLRARLAWPRCAEGMQWSRQAGTCTGKPRLLDRAEAAALASDRWKAEGVAWRLPRAPELQRLIDRTASPPGLNAALFPAAPAQWHWSATANVAAQRGNPYNYNTVMQGRSGDAAAQMGAINGWAVNLSTGEARGDVARASKLPVRLVRPLGEAEAPQ